jgi:hypothetical protein
VTQLDALEPVGELRAAIVQEADSGRVLMLAWMDDEAERRTRESGEAWFWSRSRSEYWHKGATSGNTMAASLPPNSSVSLLSVPDALSMIRRPVGVEPVKLILSTPG